MSLKLRIILSLIVLVILFFSLFFHFILAVPENFPVNTTYTVEKGWGLNSLAQDLKNKDIINSTFWFKTFSVLLGGTKKIVAGDYTLNKKENSFILAERFVAGDFKLEPIKITIPEGLNISEIAKILSDKFVKIKEQDFIKLASSSEGYLFPDTYLFLPNITSDQVVKEMKQTFIKKVASSTPDIIKMASILELEARTTETRRIVAGILWNRLAKGIPLQVDASFKYINGKTTKTLTTEDLKLNSPYNSYVNKGLPPTPISNPGLDSIKAAMTPIKTNYFYFLTDNNGVMHYAKTYDKHLQNKQIYLK